MVQRFQNLVWESRIIQEARVHERHEDARAKVKRKRKQKFEVRKWERMQRKHNDGEEMYPTLFEDGPGERINSPFRDFFSQGIEALQPEEEGFWKGVMTPSQREVDAERLRVPDYQAGYMDTYHHRPRVGILHAGSAHYSPAASGVHGVLDPSLGDDMLRHSSEYWALADATSADKYSPMYADPATVAAAAGGSGEGVDQSAYMYTDYQGEYYDQYYQGENIAAEKAAAAAAASNGWADVSLLENGPQRGATTPTTAADWPSVSMPPPPPAGTGASEVYGGGGYLPAGAGRARRWEPQGQPKDDGWTLVSQFRSRASEAGAVLSAAGGASEDENAWWAAPALAKPAGQTDPAPSGAQLGRAGRKMAVAAARQAVVASAPVLERPAPGKSTKASSGGSGGSPNGSNGSARTGMWSGFGAASSSSPSSGSSPNFRSGSGSSSGRTSGNTGIGWDVAPATGRQADGGAAGGSDDDTSSGAGVVDGKGMSKPSNGANSGEDLEWSWTSPAKGNSSAPSKARSVTRLPRGEHGRPQYGPGFWPAASPASQPKAQGNSLGKKGAPLRSSGLRAGNGVGAARAQEPAPSNGARDNLSAGTNAADQRGRRLQSAS